MANQFIIELYNEKKPDEMDIEAGVQESSKINNEIISTMRTFLDLIIEISTLCNPMDYGHIKEAAILAKAAAQLCQEENIAIAYRSIDDTFAYVLRRESQ